MIVRGLACSAVVFLALVVPARSATVLITGANSGLGLEFARQYAADGWDVIATHRRASLPATLAELQSKFDNVRIETIDVTSETDAAALAERLRDVPIDVLINNAGVYSDRSGCTTEGCEGDISAQTFGNLDFDLWRTIYSVNVMGPLNVSQALMSNVLAGAQKKIVAVSSSTGSLSLPSRGPGSIFYRSSKAALNRAMQLVAMGLREAGVTVVILNPGPVLTERQEWLRKDFEDVMLEMPESVGGMIRRIEEATIEDSGRFVQWDGEIVPW